MKTVRKKVLVKDFYKKFDWIFTKTLIEFFVLENMKTGRICKKDTSPAARLSKSKFVLKDEICVGDFCANKIGQTPAIIYKNYQKIYNGDKVCILYSCQNGE